MWLPYKIFFVTLHILTLPLQLLIFLILFLYKQIVCLLAQLFQDFEGPVPATNCLFIADAIWKQPNCTIVFANDLDGQVTRETLAATMQKSYDIRDKNGRRCYREIGYRPVLYLGYAFWKKDTNLKINKIHLLKDEGGCLKIVNDNNLPSSTHTHPTSLQNHKRAVSRFIESIQRQPFGADELLWNIYILPNYKGNPNRTLVFIRFHHLMSDGISFVKYFYASAGITQLPQTFTKPSTSNIPWDNIASSVPSLINMIIRVFTVGVIDYANKMLIKAEKHALNFDEQGKLRFTGKWINTIGKKLDVELMRKASKHYDCSIVHILMAGLGKGLERYYAKYHGKEPMPEAFQYLAPVPLPGHPDMRFVNHWCAAVLNARTGIESTVDTLEYFKKETIRCATDAIPVVSALIFQTCGLLPTSLSCYASNAKGAVTVGLSNVVGPQEKDLVYAGAKLRSTMLWIPLVQQFSAITTGIVSCNGKMRFCLTADDGCIPGQKRLDELMKMIEEELAHICGLST